MLCLYWENASFRAQSPYGLCTRIYVVVSLIGCDDGATVDDRQGRIKASHPSQYVSKAQYISFILYNNPVPTLLFYQNKLPTSPARFLSDIAIQGRSTMLSSPASLQCDNDESTTTSKEPKDDSSSSCQTEPKFPEAVHADLAKYGLAVTPEGRVHYKEGGTLHPRDWHINRKLYDSFLVILFEFVA